MIIIKAKDYDDMSKKAALIVLNEIMLDKDISVGFATGSTPLGLYKKLIKKSKKENVNFSNITTFNLDEYYPIKKNDTQSYYYFMHQNLFSHVPINKKNINFLNGETKNPYEECQRFEKLIKDKGIDLQILGLGRNSHIAFNEPGSSFNSKTRVVDLDLKTQNDNSRLLKNKNRVLSNALTMGLASIMSAKKIILLASGKNKAQAVKDLIEGPIDENCPASILRQHQNVIVIIDNNATELLSSDVIPKEIAGYHILKEGDMPKNKVVVTISPHPDDSAIGPGGTLVLMSKDNELHNFVMTTGHRSYIPNT
ncbi:MAG: glucosamine-6-phosphate deaminase, partial [archaeon]